MTTRLMTNALTRPFGPLAGPAIRLFLTSATILFVELLLIRWVPANVVYVGYFSNFLLMASFLGIGAGILFGRDAKRVPISPFAPLLFAVVLLVTRAQINVQLETPNDIFFGPNNSGSANANFLVLPFIVMLVTVVMAGLAIPLGGLLTSMRPLRAYAIDIAGSMAGILAFTLLSAVGTSPLTWFAIVAIMLSLLGLGVGLSRRSLVTAISMVGVLVIALGAEAHGDVWSPYYRLHEYQGGGVNALDANGVPHQAMLPVAQSKDSFYEQIYRWFPDRHFGRVLIVGAGSGTDTALQLSHGVDSIDAVEIDPVIQSIGVRDHPDQPYSDPRVHRYVDDGRAFVRNATGTYDLVIFALPDSLTLVSTSANLRLESFLFTDQAFASVRDHLAPGGIFVLYNFYREPWLVQKMAGMLDSSFGTAPIIRLYPELGNTAATLADGPGVAALAGAAPPGDHIDKLTEATPQPATDDWPFLYLKEPAIATQYLVALGVVLLWALLLIGRGAQRSGTSFRRFSPHFFVLGVAFLLLETRSLVTFSLLFGSTWIVNSLVFFAILASVLAAIGVNARFPIRNARPLYAVLFAVLAIGYLAPPDSLLLEPAWLRYVVAGGLTFAPVFVANLVFSRSFRDTRTADMAFASNLLGAMVGGAVEYLALITGYQALLLVVAGLYALAYVFATRFRRLADRDLVDVGDVGPEGEPAPASEPATAAGSGLAATTGTTEPLTA
jgi:SAM-dependent methyltransferase